MKFRIWFLHHARQLGTLFGLLVLCAILTISTPYFFTVSNLLNVAQQTVINAIIAVGLTYVIIMGGIDLSVGSILAFSSIMMAKSWTAGVPLWLSTIIGLLAGLTCGIANGLLIGVGRLPPFIATLGMMSVARGAALMAADGRPISGFPEDFRYLAQGELLRIPVPILIMVAIYIVGQFGLRRTTLGRYIYAIGGNEEASKLSGVNVTLQKVTVYGISGLLAAVAGVILTARLNSAQPIAGIMYELDAIAATVIGGTSLMGGEGNLIGTLIGALIMGVLRNGLNLLEVSSFIQQSVIGSAIIIAVLIDVAIKRKRV